MDPSDKHWDDGVVMFFPLPDMLLPSGEIEGWLVTAKQPAIPVLVTGIHSSAAAWP